MSDAPPPHVPPPLAPPAPAPAGSPGPTRLQRATAGIATLGVLVALAGLLVMARPVQTPTQDCGAGIMFLLDGRTNEFADPEDPPAGATGDQATENNERPCRVRVAASARPGAVMAGTGLFVAVTAAIVEATARGVAWRRRVKARRASGQRPDPAIG